MVMGRKREAVVALEECARLAPWLGQTFVLLGGLYEQLDSPEKAFPAYEQAVRANPAWPRFRAALATALVRAHRPAEGVRHYEEMRALYPRDEALTDFALDLSQALWLEDYDQEARAVAEDALPSMRARVREKPDDVPALVQLGGLLCDSLWEFEEAQEVFRRAVELNPPMWFAHMNLQVACSKDGNPEAAAAALEEAVPRWPRQPQLRRRLGALRLQLGDFEGALEQLNAAVALGLEDPPYQLLRITCLHLGRYEEALQHHLKILDRAQKLMTPGWSYSADEFRAWGETLVELSRRKQALLEGTDALASPREQLQFAYLLQDEYDAPAAMPHYREALEAEPALARAPAPGPAFCWDWQTQAASAAAEAGAALGPKARQLDPAERTSLRAWALANLREALVRADERLAGADPVAGTQVDRMLKALRLQLPRLRYGRFHASLPSGEQAAWQTYWQDVDRVLRRAREAQVAR